MEDRGAGISRVYPPNQIRRHKRHIEWQAHRLCVIREKLRHPLLPNDCHDRFKARNLLNRANAWDSAFEAAFQSGMLAEKREDGPESPSETRLKHLRSVHKKEDNFYGTLGECLVAWFLSSSTGCTVRASRASTPDFICCQDATRVEVEVKAPAIRTPHLVDLVEQEEVQDYSDEDERECIKAALKGAERQSRGPGERRRPKRKQCYGVAVIADFCTPEAALPELAKRAMLGWVGAGSLNPRSRDHIDYLLVVDEKYDRDGIRRVALVRHPHHLPPWFELGE